MKTSTSEEKLSIEDARGAPDHHEDQVSLNAASPDLENGRGHQSPWDVYDALRTRLDRHVSLGYVSESDKSYRVRTDSDERIEMPKNRAAAPPYPPRQASPLRSPSRWLTAAFAGLLLAGIPTLVCVPVVILHTLSLWMTGRLDQGEKADAAMLILNAFFLLGVGALLSALLLVHII